MKKILAVIIILSITIVSCGCGNMSIGFGNYAFKKVHINTHHYSKCLTIESWYDSEYGGVEVKTKEVGAMFLSEGTYILIENTCPFCDN